MRNWLRESIRTFAVTTYHPLGWGFDRVHSTLIRSPVEYSGHEKAEHLAPVILVHGVFHNASAFFQFERVLAKEGFRHRRTLELWTSIHSIARMADQLKRVVRDTLAQSKERNPLGKARIVAHSLGGMVARVALRDKAFTKLVDKVVFLGVPHQGNLLFQIPFPPFTRELRRRSELIAKLRAEPLPAGVRFWNLRGGLDLVTRGSTTFLPHVPNLIFAGVGHAGLLHDRNVIRAVVRILETPYSDPKEDR